MCTILDKVDFSYFSTISLYHKWSETRLLSQKVNMGFAERLKT